MSATVTLPFPDQHLPRLDSLVCRLQAASPDQNEVQLLQRIFLAGLAAMESATANQPVISPAAPNQEAPQ